MSDIHSCSYYCTRMECVAAQRDQLRSALGVLAKYIALLEDDGPQIERAREDGNVIMGSMRECLEDARMALAAEESIAEALRLQVADLERDAARYRFLEADFSPMGLDIDGNHVWAYRRNASLKGPTLSAAIDAAIG